ncbi:TRAP transporter large permease [Photobacterium sp. DNB23_23_1]
MTLALPAIFFSMLFLGVPIAFIIFALSVYCVVNNPALMDFVLAQRIILGAQSFPLLAVPLFILVGELMNLSGISSKVMAFCAILTRKMTGGLAQTNILLSCLLAGMSGSSNADAAMQAKFLVPQMVKRGYPLEFATALTAASALISPMIPPGICLILFGFAANVSIGQMFIAAIIPGILLAIGLMVTTHFYVKIKKFKLVGCEQEVSQGLTSTFVAALPAIVLPAFIVIGIRFGVFTPTEAASVAVVYCLFLCWRYGTLEAKPLYKILQNTAFATSAIILVLVASSAFSWVVTFEQIPQQISHFLIGLNAGPTLTLALLALLLLVLGMFIEGTALVLILGPMFIPVMQAMGVDLIHYGIVFVFMTHLGGVSPPVGVVMFTACSVTGVRIDKCIRAIMPYILTVMCVGVLLIIFPQLSTLFTN